MTTIKSIYPSLNSEDLIRDINPNMPAEEAINIIKLNNKISGITEQFNVAFNAILVRWGYKPSEWEFYECTYNPEGTKTLSPCEVYENVFKSIFSDDVEFCALPGNVLYAQIEENDWNFGSTGYSVFIREKVKKYKKPNLS